MTDIKRDIFKELSGWKQSSIRKPLIVRGARQVGKSYSIRKWASEHFEKANILEIDLEQRKDLHLLFKKDLQIDRIIDELQLSTGCNLRHIPSLLFIDEVQACPEVIVSLRYFHEQFPQLYVIAAGSLLDFILEEISFPVGRVESIYQRPVSFFEFLDACQKPQLRDYLETIALEEKLSQPVYDELSLLLKQYFLIGGMPEAMSEYLTNKDIEKVSTIHRQILTAYEDDFPKYSKKADWEALSSMFRKVPGVIGNTRIIYSKLDRDYRVEKIKRALQLLISAQVITPVISTNSTSPPLSVGANDGLFKLIFLDIGLLQHSLGFDWTQIAPNSDLTQICNGRFAEQFVGQEFLAAQNVFTKGRLYYWLRPKASAEVDYIINHNNLVCPVEVKSGSRGRLRSLTEYQKRFSPTKSFVLSQRNIENLDDTTCLPMYLASRIVKNSNYTARK